MKRSMPELPLKRCTRRGPLLYSEKCAFARPDGDPTGKSRVRRRLSAALENSGAVQARAHGGERGVRPRYIRHAFACRSFHASGDAFENAAPFPPACPGHENIMEAGRCPRFSYELRSEAHDKTSDYAGGLPPEADAWKKQMHFQGLRLPIQ
jgi:hypothetical protein